MARTEKLWEHLPSGREHRCGRETGLTVGQFYCLIDSIILDELLDLLHRLLLLTPPPSFPSFLLFFFVFLSSFSLNFSSPLWCMFMHVSACVFACVGTHVRALGVFSIPLGSEASHTKDPERLSESQSRLASLLWAFPVPSLLELRYQVSRHAHIFFPRSSGNSNPSSPPALLPAETSPYLETSLKTRFPCVSLAILELAL